MNLTVERPKDNSQLKVVELQGKVPEPINLKPYEVVGTVDSVSNFLKTRNNTINPNTSYVEFDEQEREIKLTIDADSPLKVVVTGALVSHPDLVALHINGKTLLPLNGDGGMKELLRLNRALFADRTAHSEVISKLANWKLNVNRKFESKSDIKTSTANSSFDQDVDWTPITFELHMPVFLGQPKKRFAVEIYCNANDAGPKFWLESLDLKDIEHDETERILKSEKEIIEKILVSESDIVGHEDAVTVARPLSIIHK